MRDQVAFKYATQLQSVFAARRAERAQHKALVHDLAGYRTPRDMQELHAIIDRAEPAAAERLRTLVDQNRAA